MATINEMCNEVGKYNDLFKAKTYPDAVEQFYAKYNRIFVELNDKVEEQAKNIEEKYCSEEGPKELEKVKSLINKDKGEPEVERPKLSEQMRVIVDAVASDFFAEIVEASKIKGKIPKGRNMMDLNIYMVMYVFPGIIATEREFAYYIAESIGKKWPDVFGGNPLGCADFDTINSGFRRKLCYITTAVCDSLGKGDDCEELNMLRAFRDGYMMTVKGGKELVEEYYDTAPAIVQRINMMPEAKRIYGSLYKEYIRPCIEFIKNDMLEECLYHYKEMVEKFR